MKGMRTDRFREPITLAKRENPLRTEGKVELPRLHVVVERQAGVSMDLRYVHDGDVCRIGAHPSNDLVIQDRTISRFHCRVIRTARGWRIVDGCSRNGTIVDGVRILAAELDRELVIVLGDSALRVRPAAEGEGRTVPRVSSFGRLVGTSLAMQQLFAVLARVAPSDIDVLITGESGTGKELVACELTSRGPRAKAPFVVVDCGAISAGLVESEFFGHVRGAFTGADRDRTGAFEAADRGTVFLDEIGELPLEMQPKLLRALEAREIRRLGETKSRTVDVRVVAATHRDLEREVNQGRFREDLYYRLAKVNVRVPPLRDRSDDIESLVKSFVAATGREGAPKLLAPDMLATLRDHDWPGNVRELKNFVERALVLGSVPPPATRSGIMPKHKGPPSVGSAAELAVPEIDPNVSFRAAKEAVVEAFERGYIGPLLRRCNGNVSKAARMARMDRTYLHQLAHKYGIRKGE